MPRCLVQIFSSTNFIAAMAALETLDPGGEMAADLCLVWPDDDAERTRELVDTVSAFARGFGRAGRVKAFLAGELAAFCAMPGRDEACEAFRQALGQDYDLILYAHNVVGESYGLMAATWPQARRVCYGDAFGNVYEREVHLGLLGIQARHHPWFGNPEPHLACLVLPVDQSGRFLSHVPLRVVERATLLSVLERCRLAHGGLSGYLEGLLQALAGRPGLLLLTENNAEGGFMALEDEVRMYSEMVRSFLAPGGVVVIKAHPGETLPRGELLAQALEGYETHIVPPGLRRIPVELMAPLVEACEVACLSYPILSLPYLFGKRVRHSLTLDFIRRYFSEWTWDSYANCLDLYLRPLEALEGWDGAGPLWSGGPGPGTTHASGVGARDEA